MLLEIWSDGASNVHNPKNPGGWASVLVCNNTILKQLSGPEINTTNQRMEIMGALKGLEYYLNNKGEFKDITEIRVITDSGYLYNCMIQKWYVNWKFNNWIGSEGQEIKNKDLWEQLLDILKQYKEQNISVTWRKIRGHKGLIFNEVADKLAVRAKESVS